MPKTANLQLKTIQNVAFAICSLSEFSDENMMDPYNLAICFGPTLLRVPVDRDPVHFQPHIIELVRNIVIHQEDVFILDDPTADGATLYEKCLIGDDVYVCGVYNPRIL